MELSSWDPPHEQFFKCQTVIGEAFKHCRGIFLVLDFKTFEHWIDTLPKCSGWHQQNYKYRSVHQFEHHARSPLLIDRHSAWLSVYCLYDNCHCGFPHNSY